MTRWTTWCLLLCLPLGASAQTIFIPDLNLRTWLNNAKPNSVDAGGLCDTAAWNAVPPNLVSLHTYQLANGTLVDLEGIQYLKMNELRTLGDGQDTITFLWPGYPPALSNFWLNNDFVDDFTPQPGPLPATVISYRCTNCGITQLPQGEGVLFMYVENTDLSGQVLDVPASVGNLTLKNCSLTSAPAMEDVNWLDISYNPLTSWINLPGTLQSLDASYIDLSTLPDLTGNTDLFRLILHGNGHTSIPVIPPGLTKLSMSDNQLSAIPSLMGTNLEELTLRNNPFSQLPALPNSLEDLFVDGTMISTLPASLPPQLRWLSARNTPLTAVPDLPPTLRFLQIDTTLVTSVPDLPSLMITLSVQGNTGIDCIPVLPQGISQVKLQGSGVSCLPNIPSSLNTSMGILGIAPVVCNVATSPCPFVQPVIHGSTFLDLGGNGVLDVGEVGRPNTLVIAQPGDLVTASDANGEYVLPAMLGSFTTQGEDLLYHTTTTAPLASTFTLPNDIAGPHHVGYDPIPGMIDLVTDLVGGVVRPGFNTSLWLSVRNVGTEPTDGTVQLTFDAALNYTDATVLPDDVSGNVVTWTLPLLAPGEEWQARVYFYLPPSTPLGQAVMHTALATPVLPDQTPMDNAYALSDVVVGSYDPNDKQVVPDVLSPAEVMAGTRVSYTVRFQNTGTYPAERVLITDTLPEGLVPVSIQFHSASHAHSWYLLSGVLHILFENINLPDSTSDEPGSHGFARLSFLASNTLTVGSSVANVANIYFDYNEPIITNSATFGVELGTGVNDLSVDGILLYPNPADAVCWLSSAFPMNGRLELMDMSGRLLRTEILTGITVPVNVEGLAPGPYLLRLVQGREVRTLQLVKR